MPTPLAGVLLQLCALLLFVSLDTCTKWLAQHHEVPQLMFLRFLSHVVLVALVLRLVTGRVPWRSRAPVLQTVRGAMLAGANLLFTTALVFVPLADAVAVGFASPLITVALAALWLREPVSPRRWSGVVLGLAGVLVALRPPFLTGEAPPHWAIFLPLGTAALFAVYQILTRRLATVDDPRTTILHTGIAGACLTALAQPFVWTEPTAFSWVLLLLAGVLGLGGHGLLIMAYARAPASLLAPISYSQLIGAVIASALVFGDQPDLWTLAGAAIVAAGGLLVAWPSRRDGG
ncbi:DMT family transporter [Roseomonas sp. OT10]|uniref:DMT family transporter n=1 Tax=Roseomonas cutis TaxID=2897332 RepID=UPI001E4498AD|nr:DMT family transporter [Roseomonas sp. OT10]UFN49894.1 DMT family transporter [Roseomonas sp. OT10]